MDVSLIGSLKDRAVCVLCYEIVVCSPSLISDGGYMKEAEQFRGYL